MKMVLSKELTASFVFESGMFGFFFFFLLKDLFVQMANPVFTVFL